MGKIRKFMGTCNLVRDAEVKTVQTPNGQTTVCNLILASNDDHKNGKTIYVKCSLWGKRAESSLPTYLKKGKQVFIDSDIKEIEVYISKDNQPKATLVVENVSIDLGGDSSSTSHSNGDETQQPEKKPPTPSTPSTPAAPATTSRSSSDWDESGDLAF